MTPTNLPTGLQHRQDVGLPELSFCGSFERPEVILDWFFYHFEKGDRAQHLIENWEARAPYAQAFWGAVSEWWPRMDKINHEEMAEAFDMFRDHWDMSLLNPDDCAKTWKLLPHKQPITIYRGQGADHPVGLSWTRDRTKAEWFARTGLRMVGPPKRPAILKTTVAKGDVALAFIARKESEVVPFFIPHNYSIELLT